VPTPPGQAYLVRYEAVDAAGNVADPRTRRVYVLCPPALQLCATDDVPSLWCCSAAASPCIDAFDAPPVALPPPAQVTLLGPADVYLQRSLRRMRRGRATRAPAPLIPWTGT
jgi:hypothetical protein